MKFFEVFRREIRQFTPVFVILVIAAVLTAASLGMGWISNADPPIKIKDSVGQGFLTILTGLAAVALLIERTLG